MASAWLYSAASFQPAIRVEDSAGRNSSGVRPLRGKISQSAISTRMIRRRSVVADIVASRRFTDVTPDAVAQRAEGVAAQHVIGARARQRDLEMVDDAAWPCRHHKHLVGEINRFG